MRNFRIIVVEILFLICITSTINIAQLPGKYTRFNINEISTYIFNNGLSDVTTEQNGGLIFPKKSKQSIVFTSGLVWGGKLNGEIRVGGSVYNTGLQPGRINDNGKVDNPESENVRPYRVRPDYKTSKYLTEIEEGEGTFEEIYLQYEKDWNEWPAENGAPYEDIDNNGRYDPAIDIPGIPNSSQTVWFVANDLDTTLTRNLYGSLPFGIEVQVTVWGYSETVPINNMLFKKYKFINKSKNDIKEMYLSIWSDFEIGHSENDYSGCDTLLNLGYMYNKESYDAYLTTIPPAIGNCLLQGPIIIGEKNDIGFIDGRQINGKKNLKMTSVHYLYPYKSNPFETPEQMLYYEPVEGDYRKGALFYYNHMQGRLADSTFYPIPVEFGGGTTRYPLSGDPITSDGFLDGVQQSSGDRSIGIGAGSFELDSQDTQEVIFAEIAAIGNSFLTSVEVLKEYSNYARAFYNQNLVTSIHSFDENIPESFELYQNYPNPFNPSTRIKYSIPKSNYVKTSIINMLGEEVKLLFSGYKNAGIYEESFDGGNYPSGIYFFQISVGGDQKVLKMMLLK